MNKPILITGCQRSGTTLLHLILDSHPDVTGIDEMDFKKFPITEYLNSSRYSPWVSFKLPAAAYEAKSMMAIPGIRILWCIRDPRDVVLSMMKLPIQAGEQGALPWAAHPRGARREIDNGIVTLQKNSISEELAALYRAFREISAKPPEAWQPGEMIFAAALCWRVKQELLALYDALGIAYHIVPYEALVKDPETTLRAALKFVGLPWHDNVLKHHQLHSGVSTGGTVNTRPIDESNTGKWAGIFDDQALSIIRSVCADMAAKYGYRLSD